MCEYKSSRLVREKIPLNYKQVLQAYSSLLIQPNEKLLKANSQKQLDKKRIESEAKHFFLFFGKKFLWNTFLRVSIVN